MIDIKNLSLAYNENVVLKDINLKLEKEKIHVIIGKNGCGKTSLLKAISKQVKYQGAITIAGVNLIDMNNKQRAQNISYLPQINVAPSISVSRLVQHGRFPYTSYSKKQQEEDELIIEKSLEHADMAYLKDKYLKELSGGEMQRAYFAMVLCQDTDVVILDEPCNFLDIDHQLSIIEVIKKLKELGKTVILVLHDLQQAFTIADNIIVIENQSIAIQGTASNVAFSSVIERVFNVSLKSIEDGIYDYIICKKTI